MISLKALAAGSLFGLVAVSIVGGAAHAGERYSIPPAIKLSPDLSQPLVLQLENRPAKIHRYNEVRRQRARQRSENIQRDLRPSAGATTTQKRRKVQQASIQRQPQAPVSSRQLDPKFLPQTVSYPTDKAPGTIVIDTPNRFLYLVQANGKARRYGVGVGKQGFEWRGVNKITRKAEWPGWTPPKEMIARERAKGRILPSHMPGGPENPLGARALYLGSTLYRIHGTNQPWSIGLAVSSGCIRMRNEDVMDLYERTKLGATVHVI